MTATRSYSLPDEVVNYVDNLPKRERSKFVASSLKRAVRKQSKINALQVLRAIVPVKTDDPRSSVELVEESRKIRLDHLIGNIKE